VGVKGQLKLKEAKVLVVGGGGLGGPLLQSLAAAGIGELTVCDADIVSISNLHRQFLFSEHDVGQFKVDVLKTRLEAQNSFIRVNAIRDRLMAQNGQNWVEWADVVIDGTDNFETRYLLDDLCCTYHKPLIYGALDQFSGQVSVFHYQNGPSYRCLYPEAPQAGTVKNCAEAGVLGVLPAIVGNMQAMECLKIVLGVGEVLSGKLWMYNALDAQIRILKFKRDEDNFLPRPLQDYIFSCEIESDSSQIEVSEFDFTLLEEWKKQGQKWVFVDVRDLDECNALGQNHPAILSCPLQSVNENISQLIDLNNDSILVFFCSAGIRSEQALKTFVQNAVNQGQKPQVFHIPHGLIATDYEELVRFSL
jgi:sulfur-carrier protein adenylyltransferase/sulfurtransferase